jgi:hypothetical protein
MKDLLNCKSGDHIEVYMEGGRLIDAIVSIQGGRDIHGKEVLEYFLCQNIANGKSCRETYGKNFSWCVGDGSEVALLRNNVHFPTEVVEIKDGLENWKERVVSDSKKNSDTLVFESGNFTILPEFRFPGSFSTLHLPRILTECETLLLTVFTLTNLYASNNLKTGIKETTSGRRRSSIDVWRHAKFFKPEIEIFDVMRALWNLEKMRVLHSIFCTDVNKRVFCKNYDNSEIGRGIPDEFGGTSESWALFFTEEQCP